MPPLTVERAAIGDHIEPSEGKRAVAYDGRACVGITAAKGHRAGGGFGEAGRAAELGGDGAGLKRVGGAGERAGDAAGDGARGEGDSAERFVESSEVERATVDGECTSVGDSLIRCKQEGAGIYGSGAGIRVISTEEGAARTSLGEAASPTDNAAEGGG